MAEAMSTTYSLADLGESSSMSSVCGLSRRAVVDRSKIISFAPGIQKRFASTSPQDRFDVVVVGSGCAGLTAAAVAAKQGLKVLVAEKSQFLGGTTAYSGGGAWIPANKHQKAIGVDDNSQTAKKYLQIVLGDLYDDHKIKAFLSSGPEMVEWLEANTSMKFKPVPLPDYHVAKEGSSVGRTLLTEAFDGKVMGRELLRKIRYTLDGFHAFGSMQADPAELAVLTKPFGSLGNFAFCTRKAMRYAMDVLRYGKGAVMANGNALVGRLVYSCKELGVDIRTCTPVVRGLSNDHGRVIGVEAEKADGSIHKIHADIGVVLASGGFGRSEEAKQNFPHEWCAQPKHNVGDGRRIGVECGGFLPPPNPQNGIFAPISLRTTKDGQVRRYPHFAIDRSKPGSIIVGPDGRRFANESEPYQEFVSTMHRENIKKAYFIADRRFLRKYGMGMALPAPYPVRHRIRQGYLIEAASIPLLAAKLGLPVANLVQTVAECNSFAVTGKDPQFHRGDTSYDQFYGDPTTGFSNPNLGTCTKGPFYALPLYPGNVSTTHGLSTNGDAQVLNEAGQPVPGLYAVGLDSNSVMRGTYPGGGSSIGPSMTFGYRAGLALSKSP